MLKIIYYFLFFTFYLHIVGCLWFATVESTYKTTVRRAEWCVSHLDSYSATSSQESLNNLLYYCDYKVNPDDVLNENNDLFPSVEKAMANVAPW